MEIHQWEQLMAKVMVTHNSADEKFLQEMIPIKTTQEHEISVMKNLLAAWGAKPASKMMMH